MSARSALAGSALVAIVALTAIPLAVLASSLWHVDQQIWGHLLQYVLPELLANTFWLMLGVGIGVTLVGASLAWLTAACDYPGRSFFGWALLLPLALPAYITAFVWIGLLDFNGVVPVWLREHWGLRWVPEIRSRAGVILVMVLALYPYVYLTARAAFLGQSRLLLEAAQSLGLSRRRAFFRLVLPIAYPGIMAGVVLALMETLADFGAVSVFNYNTLTTAIYQTWFGLFSLQTASQLATLLALGVILLVFAENHVRAARTYASPHADAKATRIALTGWPRWLAVGLSSLVLLLAFGLPFLQLLFWAAQAWAHDFDARYLEFVGHSLLLGGLGATLVLVLAVMLAYLGRSWPSAGMLLVTRLATIGYALPGAVLAVGFFIPVAWLDNQIMPLLNRVGIEYGQLLGGSLAVMLLAYGARFLAVGFAPVEAGLGRVSRSMDEAAQSLGVAGWRRLHQVHLPLVRTSLLTAAALVFVDIMKELPMTLMTRPFGWDTLAVRVFEMTSEGEWGRAALPAVAIVLAGLLPVTFLIRQSQHAEA